MTTTSIRQVLNVKEQVKAMLQDADGVNGIGVSWDDEGIPFVQVNVEPQLRPDIQLLLPHDIDGVLIGIEDISDVHAL
ncbi:MAG: hypothetical protein JXQ72_12430 [Anaerolineae bacterium]|nr:hypothetical protein [Anaerolineae bacterium]